MVGALLIVAAFLLNEERGALSATQRVGDEGHPAPSRAGWRRSPSGAQFRDPRGPAAMMSVTYRSRVFILVGLALALIVLSAGLLIARNLSKETRAEALERCRNAATARRGIDVVDVRRQRDRWVCEFGSGIP